MIDHIVHWCSNLLLGPAVDEPHSPGVPRIAVEVLHRQLLASVGTGFVDDSASVNGPCMVKKKKVEWNGVPIDHAI